MNWKVIELQIGDEYTGDTKVEAIALVLHPAIESQFLYFNKQDFVEPKAGEDKDEFIGRCIPKLKDEGYPEDQAAAICYSYWENRFSEECDCDKDNFGVTIIDGMPVYENIQDALEHAEGIGCEGAHQIEIDGEVYYLPCEINVDELEDLGDELEDLLDNGYVISEVKEVDAQSIYDKLKSDSVNMTKEQFYQIITSPSEKSYLDFGNIRRRYVYVVGSGAPLIPTSRNFCRRMLGGRQFVFRFEDIMKLNAQLNAEPDNYKIIPRPKGTKIDIFTYKAGGNCRHKWLELNFVGPMNQEDDRKITNNKRKMLEDADLVIDAYGQPGQVNPPVQYGSRSPASVGLSKDVEFSPIGFLQGLAIFQTKDEAKDYSEKIGCSGVIEEVDYRGQKAFQACSYKKQEKMTKFSYDNEKRIIYSPIMKPGILIPRIDEITREKYFVTFTPETIEKMAYRFIREKRTDATNYEHTDIKLDGVYMVESWIVAGDQDKAYQLGYTKDDIPVGTWFGAWKVDNDEVWEMVKRGEVRGVSLEGNFEYNMSAQDTDEYDDYLLCKIIDIIKNI